jgi:hypothetical protein
MRWAGLMSWQNHVARASSPASFGGVSPPVPWAGSLPAPEPGTGTVPALAAEDGRATWKPFPIFHPRFLSLSARPNDLRRLATLARLTLALILTFPHVEKEQRRRVRVARVVGLRLRRRVVVVISSGNFWHRLRGAGGWGRFPGVSLPGRSTPGFQPFRLARGVLDCGGKRHAAFVRATVLKSSRPARACESAVAAGALPAQSMTRTELPGASQLRGALWPATGGQALAMQHNLVAISPFHPSAFILQPFRLGFLLSFCLAVR